MSTKTMVNISFFVFIYILAKFIMFDADEKAIQKMQAVTLFVIMIFTWQIWCRIVDKL